MEHAKNNDTSKNKDLKQRWQRHIKAWWEGCATQISYCKKHGLSRHAFLYWKHIFEKRKTEGFVEIKRAAPPGTAAWWRPSLTVLFRSECRQG
ncbi:MAG: hypothetical protein JSV89_05860 [Spirochaetaceae bacterium]|nr:MAG: hypothetical protein JSV89_05860 [Spirochaetaceae bacterium]